jgi:quinol-cytochrome oxidoreductase complex cytochrome b subunit
MVLLGLVGLVVAVIPLYDTREAPPHRARVATWIGGVLIAGLVVFTVWGYMAL